MNERGRINTRAFIPVAHSNGIIDVTSKFASSLYLLDHLSEEEDDDDLCDSWSNRTTPTGQIPAPHGWSDVTLTGSYASWEDDEEGVLDRVAAEQVGLMFDAIDQSLYEGQDTGFQQMDKECVYWRESFPHLRIKGQHLLDSLEDGTEIVDPIVISNSGCSSSSSKTPRNMTGTELGITGESMKLCSPPPVMVGDSSDGHSPGLHYEEILACDGEVEEYFAYNYSTSDRDMAAMKRSSTYSHHRNAHKIPPVSPSSCLKDTVSALLFDQIWTEVASVLHPLIKSSCQRTSLSQEDGHLPSQGHVPIHEFFLPKNSIQPTRGGVQQGIQQMMKHRPLVPPALLPSSGVSFPTHSTNLPSLKNVMTIKPVALQQRIPSSTLPPSLSVNNSVFQPPVDICDSNVVLQDFSKILPNSRHVSFIHTPVPSRLSEPKLTSGKIGNKRNPLKPLEVPRTPGIPLIEDDLKEFGGLRGQRLVRHTQLPPLDPTQFDITTKSPQAFRSYGNKGQQVHVAFSQRIVSAVTDTRGDSGGINNKKNTPFIGGPTMDLRPNTSQTFHRSETPLTRRGSNNSVGVLLPPTSSSPIKVIGYAANLHGDPILWEEHEGELR